MGNKFCHSWTVGYNLLFISKEDEAKTAFRCPGAVGRTIMLAGDALRSESRYSYLPASNEPHLPLLYCQHRRGGVY